MAVTEATDHDTSYDKAIKTAHEIYERGFADGFYTFGCILTQILDVQTCNLLFETISSGQVDCDKVHKQVREIFASRDLHEASSPDA